MATITKRLCLEVGEYKHGDNVKTEYREIGLEIEYESSRDGSKWTEIKLYADVLSPTLFALARQKMDKGASTARVKKFDVARKTKTPDTADAPPDLDEDGNPF